MFETVKTLSIQFECSDDSKRTLSVDSPIEPTDTAAILAFANKVIESNVLVVDTDDASVQFTKLLGAEMSIKQTSEIDLGLTIEE